MPNNQSEDFSDVIAKAQRVNKDMGGLFSTETGRVAFEPRRAQQPGQDMEYDAHCDVFCLPSDKDGYEDVLNQCLRGEAILRWERDTFTKEGDFMVAVCYLTPRVVERAPQDQDAGDGEREVRPRRLP